MKQIIEYVKEGLRINKDTKLSSILSNIDVNDWTWKSAYSDNNYQNKCKENIEEFAKKYSGGIEQLYRDTYREYLGIDSNKSESYLDNYYDDEMKKHTNIVKSVGWGTYEYNHVPQGWFAFMDWVIKQKK